MGHALMENRQRSGGGRHGDHRDRDREREARVEMITGVIPAGQDVAAAPTTAGAPRITLGPTRAMTRPVSSTS